MRAFRRLIPLFLLLLTAVILLLVFWRRDTQAAFGQPVSLCPGPDLYGYTCESGTGFAYIDATQDTALYADDGITTINLPFPFTFYGTPYASVQVSSNGNLQFDSSNATYNNACLIPGPAPFMGDMIAPFWDDLDSRFFGYIETELVGEAPDRIFVIEWDDVPRFGEETDRVTFEVQLFENSHDIIFLYEDVSLFEGNNGNSATIGLQSAAQGVALQHSCNQAAVADATRLRFRHPNPANADLGLIVVQMSSSSEPPPLTEAKGDVLELVTRLNQRGVTVLPQLRTHWLSQQPPRDANWETADLTGNGRSDILLLRHSTRDFPRLTDLVVLTESTAGETTAVLHHSFSTRETAVSAVSLVQFADLTGEGILDALLEDVDRHQLYVVTAVSGIMQLHTIPEQCRGSLAIMDLNRDGRQEIVRDGCAASGRQVMQWDGSAFVVGEN